jgi:hypothetical protein
MSYWNPSQDRENRAAACKGIYSPMKYSVRVDDDHARWRYRIAATAIWGESVSVASFFIFCAEYVIRHHRQLAGVRRVIREEERKLRREKRKRDREARAAYRANPGMYLGKPPAMPKPRKRKGVKHG